MFYFIVSKLPIISNITDQSKLYKIMIVGSICYVILHAILYSNIGENIELIRKYRKYMYYLWGLDTVLTAGYLKFFNKNISAIREIDESEEESKNESTHKLTREEVLEKLQEQDKQESSSPFIKRDELVKQKSVQNQSTTVTSGQTLNHTSPKQLEQMEQLNEEENGADMSDTDIPTYKS